MNMKCPKCAAIGGIAQIPKYQDPVSTAFIFFLSWYVLIFFPALPSKFRCTRCGNIFRRYSISGYILLCAIALVFGIPLLLYAAQGAICFGRYLSWYLQRCFS
jgi:phage FluMu protein Com